ncbi:MAG: GTPase Era [SAR86 cluster bacterium]|uniref:GTPase Era n=1 Tax=SAR86 cluster bacterium TaxID=2030880 RepID=A0A2A5C8Y8_9GAMM|nr:MAG: GTPase Era [SAR86 cluster bacterium]
MTQSNKNTTENHCGLVAIVGRPNVGKSTLLNHILGQKLSITSRKPQTTRHRLLGIKTTEHAQIIFVDTPGLHIGIDKALNRYMNKTVSAVIRDVDLILFMIDANKWTAEDEKVLMNIRNTKVPAFLLLNKIDRINDKASLLPFIEELKSKYDFDEIIPLSALKNQGTDELEVLITKSLPLGSYLFPEDQITDKNGRFLAAEFVREKITRQTGDELPYEVNVEIEEFKSKEGVLHISALILVEREGQKKILIGKKGAGLKLIGTEARKEMERLFDAKVMLNLWVKVKSGWSDDERALRSLGYIDQ